MAGTGLIFGQYDPSRNSGFAGGYAPPGGIMGRTPAGGFYMGGQQQQPAPSDPLTTSGNLYNKAVEQQAGDYGDIMKSYREQYAKLSQLPQMQNPGTYSPQMYNYKPTADFQSAMSNLKNLSETGGYSEQDINNLRERGISPIRSVYANAQRNVDRQRALAGGYSPSYNATSAKMAREMSDQIANQVTNVNAGLAERIAQNKLGIAPTYASAAGQENQLSSGYGAKNVDTANEAQRFNLEMPLKIGQYNQGLSGAALNALQGMTSLYGTTPAMSSLFGNQALNAYQLQNQITQQNKQSDNQRINSFMPAMRLG
jgi:hypothetical protein